MEHGPGDLTEAQQQQLLDLLGSELRAAVAQAGGDGDQGLRGAALAAHLEDRRAALEQDMEEPQDVDVNS